MTLLFIDSFDHYATAELDLKYDQYASSTVGAGGRWSSQALLTGSTNHGVGKTIAASSTVVAGFAWYRAGSPGMTNTRFIQLLEDSTVHIDVRPTSSDVLTVTRNGTLLVTCSTVLTSNTWYYIEVKVKIHDSAGEVYVKVNGVEETYTWVTGTQTTQDTRNGGTGVVNVVKLGLSSSGSAGLSGYYDDLYILNTGGSAPCNDFLGDVRVEALFPSGAGNSADFTASPAVSNYQNVDDTTAPDEDSTYNASSTLNEVDTFAMTNMTATSGTVYGIQTNLYARKDDAGARSIAPVFRISGSDYVGSNSALQGGWDYHHQVYELQPVGGTPAWDVSTVNALEAGYKLTV